MRLLAPVLLAQLVLIAGCEAILGADFDEKHATTASATSTSGTVTSTSGAGGAGGQGSGGSGGGVTCTDSLPPGADGLGLYDPIAQHFFLLRSGGDGELEFDVAGDGNTPAALPIAGHWSGGVAEWVGLYEPGTAVYRLREAHSSAPPTITFDFGAPAPGNRPVAGDWGTGVADMPGPSSGLSTIGVHAQQQNTFYLKKDNTGGLADFTFQVGAPAAIYLPIAGDWDGDLVDSAGVFWPGGLEFLLKNTHTNGVADITIDVEGAQANWLPVAGDWDADGDDDVGLYDQAASEFHLRRGPGDYLCVQFGEPGQSRLPLAGAWGP